MVVAAAARFASCNLMDFWLVARRCSAPAVSVTMVITTIGPPPAHAARAATMIAMDSWVGAATDIGVGVRLVLAGRGWKSGEAVAHVS